MRDAIITGWGKCLPPAVLSNSDLETVTDTSDEWITTRTGIKARRISHVETSDLSAVAAQRAMASAGVVCLQEFAQYDDWRIEKNMTVIGAAIREKADPERFNNQGGYL